MTLEQMSRLRGGVYRLLGAGFSYPTLEMISVAGGAMTVFEDLDLFDFAFAPQLASAVDELSRAELEGLAVAHVALFEVGVGGAACPPYESAHRSNPRTGEVADLQSELKRSILRYGLKVDDRSPGLIDHVATEMHVMTMLCRRETELRAGGEPVGRTISQQEEFLTSHLLAWVPSFANDVIGIDRHRTYTALAEALRAFLVHERQILPLLVDGVTPRS